MFSVRVFFPIDDCNTIDDDIYLSGFCFWVILAFDIPWSSKRQWKYFYHGWGKLGERQFYSLKYFLNYSDMGV